MDKKIALLGGALLIGAAAAMGSQKQQPVEPGTVPGPGGSLIPIDPPYVPPGETVTPPSTPSGGSNDPGATAPTVVPNLPGTIIQPGYYTKRVCWELTEEGETYSDCVSWEEALENGWVLADGTLIGDSDPAFRFDIVTVWVPPVTQI